jgi:hypothetical protein
MSVLVQASNIVFLARELAEGLRGGDEAVADARELESMIREAEGWLLSARRFLDPADPLGRGTGPTGTASGER